MVLVSHLEGVLMLGCWRSKGKASNVWELAETQGISWVGQSIGESEKENTYRSGGCGENKRKKEGRERKKTIYTKA